MPTRSAIPADAPLHAGEIWDYDKAVDYIEKIGYQARDMAESEVKRYLGWYGQAISYKVGEREILDIREDAMARLGTRFRSEGLPPTDAGGRRHPARPPPRGDGLIKRSFDLAPRSRTTATSSCRAW